MLKDLYKKFDYKDPRQRAILLAVVGVLLIFLALIRMIGKDENKPTAASSSDESSQQSEQPITKTSTAWTYDNKQNKWVDSPPSIGDCREIVMLSNSPVEVAKATSILYPGQTRGGSYRTQGGFRFDNSRPEDITVKTPIDSVLIGGSRYIESGEVQYLLDFQSPCGIAYRFDHLLTLSPVFQAIANKFPAAKVNDSTGTYISPSVEFKAGETVATAVGFSKTDNVSMDFGVYDYRAPNAASRNAAFAAAHADTRATAYYGLCWFNMLPAPDAAVVKKLPSGDQKTGKKSDYCK